jgi:hypothetical protein
MQIHGDDKDEWKLNQIEKLGYAANRIHKMISDKW